MGGDYDALGRLAMSPHCPHVSRIFIERAEWEQSWEICFTSGCCRLRDSFVPESGDFAADPTVGGGALHPDSHHRLALLTILRLQTKLRPSSGG